MARRDGNGAVVQKFGRNDVTPLQRIGIQCGEPDLEQQILSACHNKQAFLFLLPGAGVVLRPMGEVVLLWAAWSELRDGMSRYLGFVLDMAREVGAECIEFRSKRKGLLRAAPALGWVYVGDDNDGFMVFRMGVRRE